jgi:hypothetical protein
MYILLLLAQMMTMEDKLSWTVPNVTAAQAQMMIYKYYIGPSTVGVELTGVICKESAPVNPVTICRATMPKLMLGGYTIYITSTDPITKVESNKGTPYTFTLVNKPPTPTNIGNTP